MKSEKITFTSKQGIELAARLDLPESEPVAYALAAHCFTCTKDMPSMHHISTALVERGVGVLRFDFTGLGHSGGEFANSGFRANLDDLRSALDYLGTRGAPPQILLGHSLGGTAMLAIAHEVPSAKLVVTIGSPYEPSHARHYFSPEVLAELDAKGKLEVKLAGRAFIISKEFVQQLEGNDMAAWIRAIRAHIMVFQDPEDEVVEIHNARLIYDAAHHPKSFLSLPKAGHMLNRNNGKDADYVAAIIATTANRYLVQA